MFLSCGACAAYDVWRCGSAELEQVISESNRLSAKQSEINRRSLEEAKTAQQEALAEAEANYKAAQNAYKQTERSTNEAIQACQDAIDTESISGTVSKVINFSTGSAEVYSEDGSSMAGGYSAEILIDSPRNLLLGMTAKVRIMLSQLDETLAISIIASISLIVGGVGVMNIMLISIVERTKEIGIRKALGARNSSIRAQFLTEAVIMCLIGGILRILIGMLNGFLLVKAGSYLLETFYSDYIGVLTITIQPSMFTIVISIIFSMAIGMIFGYYPANRAAKLSPITALGYEQG